MKREREIVCASAKYSTTVAEEKAFQKGARWADATMIDKACEWLMHNVNRYINDEGAGYFRIEKTLFDHFRKAMGD